MKQTEKWCPMARLSVTDTPESHHSANRFYGTEQFGMENARRCQCLADACAVFNVEKACCGLIGK